MDPLVLVTGVIVAAAVFLAVATLQGSIGATRRLVHERTTGFATSSEDGSSAAHLNIPRLNDLSARRLQLDFELERAGLSLNGSEYVSMRFGLGLLLATPAFLLATGLGVGALWILFVLVAFVIGYHLPSWYVKRRTAHRLRLVEEQLLDALVSMTKSLRAGVGLTQAIEYTGRETPAPLGPELQRTVRELQLGADLEVVLEALNTRVGSPDLEIVSTAIIIQRRVGGNLTEILTNVANTIRERRGIRAELNAMTAQQRLQGNLSALIPVFVAVFFFVVNPDSASYLFTTTVGIIALSVGIFFELLGLWMIRKFSVIEV